jgi:hypothetical protein
MFDTHASRHAESVLSALSQFMHDPRVRIQTPSGESMLPARGMFADGCPVMAPGIDDFSPRRRATVISTGVREGWDGRWCLAHFRGDRVRILVREEHLAEARDDHDDALEGTRLSSAWTSPLHMPAMVRRP